MQKINIFFKISFLSFALLTSCSSDDDPEIDPGSGPDDPDPVVITATEPCVLSDFDIQEGNTISVDCLLDLEGQIVEIPNNVTFEFDGGDIFNGTLNFASAGKIDGDLLNSKLNVEGNVTLISETFNFFPNRWEVVEATSTDASNTTPDEAYSNHLILQNVIDKTKSFGAVDFVIGTMDAFFDSNHRVTAVLGLPSDFNLRMSDNTILRVFPVDRSFSSKLIKISDQDNVTVTGGKLIGDRLNHGPTVGNSSLFDIVASRNITVENMHFSLGFTGLTVYGISWFDFADQVARPYIKSDDVIIRNNVFDSNQSNNLSVTDGANILIEGNELYRAGNDMENKFGPSLGLAPRIGIVIEPAFDGPGFTQLIENVLIKDNIVEESQTNAILALGAFRVEITGNTADATVGWTSAAEVTVTNNTIIGGGINGGTYFNGGLIEKSTNNIIANNKIQDAATGIVIENDETEVYGNEIVNSTVGIMVRNFVNGKVYDNTITNTNSTDSWGINMQFFANDVDLYNNTINLTNGLPMFFIGINRDVGNEDYEVAIFDNYFNSNRNISVTNSNGIHFNNNELENCGIVYGGASNGSFTNNIVNSNTDVAFGINRAAGSVQNITVTDNMIANTSDARLNGYGIRVNTVGNDFITENSNIEISGNIVSSVGENYGMHSSNFDGIIISKNTITNEAEFRTPFFFNGNNSVITENTFSNPNKDSEIEGNNNTVSNNTDTP